MVKIITDSASGIGVELAEKLGVEVIPIPILVDETEVHADFSTVLGYIQDGKDIKTSQISPQTFKEVFERVLEQGDEVLYVSLSSKLSGVYNSALLAKSLLEDEYKVAIVDSLNALISQSLLVENAVIMSKKGHSLADIVEATEINKRKVKQYVIVDTLDYLYKRGRLSNVEYKLGSILKMKIVITAEEGEIRVEAKERGSKKIIKWLENKYFSESDSIDMTKPFAICYREDEEVDLNISVFDEIKTKSPSKVDISTLLLLFTGETALGVGYFSK